MHRILGVLFAIWLAAMGLIVATPAPAVAQSDTGTDAAAQAAAATAVALSRLEATGDFNTLYDLIHPDAREVVPREAVVGWFEEFFATRTTDDATVTDVEFIDWTWGVTGTTYPGTAAVSFVQPYVENGVPTEQPGTVHLVEVDGVWRWFFGANRAFVDEQIARFVNAPAGYQSAFTSSLDADVDLFWARTFATADLAYTPPNGIVPLASPAQTGCGFADPAIYVVFYCTQDRTIYYYTEFRAQIETQVGEYAWVTVIAHEWGHHVQMQLGIVANEAPGLDNGLASVSIELQADCLSGVYTQDAQARDWLAPGDLEQALLLSAAAGDPAGTSWSDPDAHGTGPQRVDAFLSGYDNGLVGCDLNLDE